MSKLRIQAEYERRRMHDVKELFGAPFAATRVRHPNWKEAGHIPAMLSDKMIRCLLAQSFWVSAFIATFGGLFMGLSGLAFCNFWRWTFDLWTGPSYEKRVNDAEWDIGGGEYIWVAYTTGAAFIIWAIKQLPWYPDEVLGVFREVKFLHSDVKGAPWVLLASAISLGAGATVGPEAALGTLGGAVGMVLGGRRPDVENRRTISMLVCMAAAMGAILPTPLISIMMIHELYIVTHATNGEICKASTRSMASSSLSSPPESLVATPRSAKRGRSHMNPLSDVGSHFFSAEPDSQRVNAAPAHDWMEQVSLMGFAATAAFIVYYGLLSSTYLEKKSISVGLYDAEYVEKLEDGNPKQFEWKPYFVVSSFGLGIVGGLIGLLIVTWLGAAKKLNDRINVRLVLNWGLPERLASLLLHLFAGSVIGLVGKALPLTFGDGFIQIESLLTNGVVKYGAKQLWCTMFAKIFLLGFSLGFGFVGGQILPCMFIGCCMGQLLSFYFPGLPWSLTVPCLFAAVPVGFAPIPFTMALTAEYIFVLGPSRSAAVFAATFMSWLTNCGIGMIQGILARTEEFEQGVDQAAERGPPGGSKYSLHSMHLDDPLLQVGETLGYTFDEDGEDSSDDEENYVPLADS